MVEINTQRNEKKIHLCRNIFFSRSQVVKVIISKYLETNRKKGPLNNVSNDRSF